MICFTLTYQNIDLTWGYRSQPVVHKKRQQKSVFMEAAAVLEMTFVLLTSCASRTFCEGSKQYLFSFKFKHFN